MDEIERMDNDECRTKWQQTSNRMTMGFRRNDNGRQTKQQRTSDGMATDVMNKEEH
jgi:hypothetical protein